MLLKKYKDLHGKEQKKQVELNAVVKDTAFWDEHNINVINFKDISIDKQVCHYYSYYFYCICYHCGSKIFIR